MTVAGTARTMSVEDGGIRRSLAHAKTFLARVGLCPSPAEREVLLCGLEPKYFSMRQMVTLRFKKGYAWSGKTAGQSWT